MIIMNFLSQQREAIKRQPKTGAADHTKKIRLILLACHLLAANLGIKGQKTPLSITKHGLAKQYADEDNPLRTEAATKKAYRDLKAIKDVFGLEGDEKTGYQLKAYFEPPKAYLQMLKYWLLHLNTHSTSTDTVLKVMLEGLVHAIESAFTNDPICMPKLSRALKEKYQKSNSRDTSRPLKQLFDERAMTNFLPLETVSEQDGTYKVNLMLEPLLMRKHSRESIGTNEDDTLVLARPGLTRSCIYGVIKGESQDMVQRLLHLAEAVRSMESWLHHPQGLCVPYALHLNQNTHEYVLVVYWQDSGHYQDIPISSIGEIPEKENVMYYCPDGLNLRLWKQWKALSYLQV